MFVRKVSEIVFKKFYKKIGKYNVCLIFVKKLLIWFREAVKDTIWKKRCYEIARWEEKKGVVKGGPRTILKYVTYQITPNTNLGNIDHRKIKLLQLDSSHQGDFNELNFLKIQSQVILKTGYVG